MTDTKRIVHCISALCPKKKHAAQWLFDYPTMWFPMCNRVRDSLMNPPYKLSPGVPAKCFTPIAPNDLDQRTGRADLRKHD